MRRSLFVISIALLGMALLYLNKPRLEEKTAYQQYAQEKIAAKRAGAVKADSPDIHALIQRSLRTREGMDAPEYGANQVMEEFIKAKGRSSKFRKELEEFDFIERGPGNVAGRTRALLIDPDDAFGRTWLAGSASGGIWKTQNAGLSWTFISDDIPNLGTNTLAMSAANSQVIYAGTGEHFTNDIDGAGMFKSTDKGESWIQIADPSVFPDFKNISRIVVDPNDENVVVATTRNSVWTGGLQAAIYKTTDGGSSWTRLRSSSTERYDDIAVDPSNFDILYVAIDGSGVIKSLDGGVTWARADEGMEPFGRVEIGISPVNPSRLWASVEGSLSGTGSDLYVTSDGGATWMLVINANGTNEDFLGGQGWYDNYVLPHPFDENIVYVGGVNNWQFELSNVPSENFLRVDVLEDQIPSFLAFENFGGGFLEGGMDLGNVLNENLLPVEIRFGQGTQKAHRFTVGGQGSGVPTEAYIYEDYVEVPFQAWDTKNNVQLMVSFRDQQEDGAWNLIEQQTSGDGSTHSREYFYVHAVPYSETASNEIAINGGFDYQRMYDFWPVLSEGEIFNPNDLPVSAITIEVTSIVSLVRTTTNVSDAYDEFSGINSFPQSRRTEGIHPDQHNAIIADINETDQTFRLMIMNDGGVYRSVSSTNPGPNEGDFIYVSNGYNTTQFYGADKAPGEDRFIGGTQDNGTWFHLSGVTGTARTFATFGIGGDGFESLWHSTDKNLLIGGSQYNRFARSVDGGETWQSATRGFNDDGPFISRLSHNKSEPNTLFTVGRQGVWKSDDFGRSWNACSMNNASMWSFSNSADVEVSVANPSIIWAGGRLSDSRRLYVSNNGGTSFNPVENYDVYNLGSVSGIATHPVEDNTAYALFSFSGYPKVLKTTDLGQTWTDISGFDGTGDRGFPDVAINCLFVFPENVNRIWVGSEIGIIESLDAGESWNLLQSSFPAVNTYDFKLVDNTLVIATYGRGIWSVVISSTPLGTKEVEQQANFVFPNPIINNATIITSKMDRQDLSVFDMNGRQVDQISFSKNQNEVQWRPQLKSGIYFLQYFKEGKMKTEKIIIK